MIDPIVFSTVALAFMVALCVIAGLLVRVCNRLDTLIAQGSKRREWVRKEHEL
jgi:hypothetical protein